MLQAKLTGSDAKGAVAAYRQSRSLVWSRLHKVRHGLKKAGAPCFLDDAAAYAHIRGLYQQDRIRPMQANLLESKGIIGIGEAAKKLGVQIRGMYFSNAEEYWSYTPQFRKNIAALPFADDSLDLVVLPHTLELSPDPHATLREVARVLVPEGRLLIFGLNPNSLWGWRQTRARFWRCFWHTRLFLPESGEFIGTSRLRDWLHLLNFETEPIRYGCYLPSVQSPLWLRRLGFLEPVGAR